MRRSSQGRFLAGMVPHLLCVLLVSWTNCIVSFAVSLLVFPMHKSRRRVAFKDGWFTYRVRDVRLMIFQFFSIFFLLLQAMILQYQSNIVQVAFPIGSSVRPRKLKSFFLARR